MAMFDTHAHLDDEQLRGKCAAVVSRANAVGVRHILAVGTTLASSRQCVDIAAQYAGVYASVGIHPNHTAEAQPGDWDAIVVLAGQSRVVALGETGLDRHWDFAPFDLQQDYFDRHLRLSQELDRAFIVHQRDCEADVLAMLRSARQRGPLRGVMHSFAGSAATATECVALGLYISFAGMVTFKKSDDLRAIAATIPADRILVETDAPYLSPHPHRGQRPNEPALVMHTAQCLADVRGISLQAFDEQATANARRLFRL
jgi:TatD DNase family protein